MQPRTARGAVAAGAAMLMPMTGCGSSAFADQDGEEVLATAAEAMADVTSFRVRAEVRLDHENVMSDFVVAEEGCSGDLEGDDLAAEVVSDGDLVWVRGNEAFWSTEVSQRKARRLVRLVGDGWIAARADLVPEVAQLCDLDLAADGLVLEEGQEPPPVDGTTSIGREEVVVLGSSSGAVYVRSTAPHHVLLLTDRELGVEVRFSEIDEPVSISWPDPEQVVGPFTTGV